MPKIQLPEKIAQAWQSKAMYKILYGGRGSGKSGGVGRIMLMDCQTRNLDVLCGREYQNSIDESVHKLLKGLIDNPEYEIKGFDYNDKKIKCVTNNKIFSFKGWARNPSNVKSAEDYGRCWGEEAESTSQNTIDILLPTIRSDGSQAWFTMNPASSQDPMATRFILPYMDAILRDGFYEDDMHFIAKVNWRDNPFWTKELEQKRRWSYENEPRARYDWIWEGEFNDSVESALIQAEWFDACVDAHKRLGFEPKGIRFSAHDPSDKGPDSKGFAFRHGSVIQDVQEKIEGDINQGCDWALDLAINHRSDAFTWDCDGMGVGLNRDITKSFEGKHTVISQFKGSEGVDNPDAIFQPATGAPIQEQKTNKEALANKRAQNYLRLRRRCYKTWQAINGTYHNPDDLISFSSEIKDLAKLRSELCRMPIKPNKNGLFEMYTKQEMKTKFKYKSPNLADPVMMLMRVPHMNRNTTPVIRPQPIRTMGRR